LDAPAVAATADGSFTLRGVAPGRYLLQVSPLSTAGAYVKSARFADGDIPNGGFQLERNPDTRYLQSFSTFVRKTCHV